MVDENLARPRPLSPHERIFYVALPASHPTSLIHILVVVIIEADLFPRRIRDREPIIAQCRDHEHEEPLVFLHFFTPKMTRAQTAYAVRPRAFSAAVDSSTSR